MQISYLNVQYTVHFSIYISLVHVYKIVLYLKPGIQQTIFDTINNPSNHKLSYLEWVVIFWRHLPGLRALWCVIRSSPDHHSMEWMSPLWHPCPYSFFTPSCKGEKKQRLLDLTPICGGSMGVSCETEHFFFWMFFTTGLTRCKWTLTIYTWLPIDSHFVSTHVLLENWQVDLFGTAM